jgi:hypothetical protein
MPLLNPGDPFPRLTISTTDGRTQTLPDAFAGDFGVVLLYRGAWCPYCNAQLRAFERAGQALADAGIRVAALSVDDQEATAALVARHNLTFPVGYGSSTPTRCSCSPPGSCSTPRVRSSSACTRAAPSGGSSPTTSSAWSATCASIRRPRRPDPRETAA